MIQNASYVVFYMIIIAFLNMRFVRYHELIVKTFWCRLFAGAEDYFMSCTCRISTIINKPLVVYNRYNFISK